MLKINGTDIELTCGDSAKLMISAKDKDGEEYEFQTGDRVVFTLKASSKKNDQTILIEKTTIVETPNKTCDIILSPSDTKDLNFTKYYYDVQLIKESGWVDTIIENSIFKVGVEIG